MNTQINEKYKDFDSLKLQKAKQLQEEIMRKLTNKEISDICFAPLVYSEIAWFFAEKAVDYARENRLEEFKKESRQFKPLKERYYDEIKKALDWKFHERLIENTKELVNSIVKDITILYFGVNQNLKTNNADELHHEEMKTWSIIATLMIDSLIDLKYRNYKLLNDKIGQAEEPNLHPVMGTLYTLMYQYSGRKSAKLDFKDKNMELALKIVRQKIDSVEFTTIANK